MFRPLLAPREGPLSYPDYWDKIIYPCWVSPKYDGIRAIVKNGVVLSRTGKPLPSLQVQEKFGCLEDFDGELIVGNPTDFDVYNRTQSHVMSVDKPADDIRFYGFDYTHEECLNDEYQDRFEIMREMLFTLDNSSVMLDEFFYFIKNKEVENIKQLLEVEIEYLSEGYEGIIIRGPESPYKCGRATMNEGIIFKLKRFEDEEARIVGFKEQLLNQNEQTTDELGYATRSTKKENMVKAGMVGAFIVEWNFMQLEVAPGNFSHGMRKYIWEHPDEFMLKILKFRYFKHGIKDKPRFPRALGFRDEMDIG